MWRAVSLQRRAVPAFSSREFQKLHVGFFSPYHLLSFGLIRKDSAPATRFSISVGLKLVHAEKYSQGSVSFRMAPRCDGRGEEEVRDGDK